MMSSTIVSIRLTKMLATLTTFVATPPFSTNVERPSI
jgi:hypothetical protein